MFTSERLHSELKHGGVGAPVIVVEGYLFLINIIVVPPEHWPPLVLCNCRLFYCQIAPRTHKTIASQSVPFVVVTCWPRNLTVNLYGFCTRIAS